MVENNTVILTDMHKALEYFDAQCTKHVGELIDKVNTHSVPACIYHYTNEAGLLGILESRKIRLTDIFGLNDPSELRHGIGYVRKLLETEEFQAYPSAKLFIRTVNETLEKDIDKIARFFVACFSREKDELGQWRAYGDNGKGFTLGFHTELLKNSFVSEYYNLVFPVIYDDNSLRKIHQKLMDEVVSRIKTLPSMRLSSEETYEFMRQLSKKLCLHVIETAIFFKHQAYENEQEYRFIQMRGRTQPVDDLKYLARNYSLVDFTEFDWHVNGQNVLHRIVIGPAADEENAQSFIKDCLNKHGFDDSKIVIRKSEIPYRG